MKYRTIKGVKGLRKFKYYKNLKYIVNNDIVEIYIADNIQKDIYKKFYNYLGILQTNEKIKEIEIKKVTDEKVKKYIDKELKGFIKKLENVEMYYSYNKQIQSQNGRIRVSNWFDKGDYRHLAWLQEQKENLENKIRNEEV